MRAYSNDREGDQLANLIFAPDSLSHFRYEHVHGAPKSPAPPEIKALMCAVLEDGITCFQGYFFTPSRTNENLFLEAEEWVNSNDDGVFSFNNVCETLGLSPSGLRKGPEQWKARPEARCLLKGEAVSSPTKTNVPGRKRRRLENRLLPSVNRPQTSGEIS